MEKMDRGFASVEWIEVYLWYALKNHPILCSDHGPITLDFELQLPFQKRPFKFEHMWTSHPACTEVVFQAWNNFTAGSQAYQLTHKVSIVKKEFVRWNKEIFGSVKQEIQSKLKQLQEVQNSIKSVDDTREESVRTYVFLMLQNICCDFI